MRFYKVTVSGSFLPDAPSTRSLGAVGSEFLEIHADDFFGDVTGDVTGDVLGDLTGDVLSADSSVCLASGATSTAATFDGTARQAKYAA